MVSQVTQGLSLVATKGRQGRRTMYQVTVPNSVLNNFFTVNLEPPAEKSQRQLDPKHARDIADYIVENPDGYVLGAVVYAVDLECGFTPSELSPNIGMLTIPFGTNLRSLDGQHRRVGLNQAIATDPALSTEDTAVLIYVEPDVTKRRQMFSDMNATPKVVAKALNVAFDSRDPFARAAQVVAEHSFLHGVVELQASRVSPASLMWYSLGSIYDVLKRLMVGPSGRVRVANQYAEEAIVERGCKFFELLDAARPEFSDVRKGASEIDIMRSRSILFSSTTLRVIAGAVWLKMDESMSTDMSRYTDNLRKADFLPSAPLWQDSGFVSPGKSTPNARNQEVMAATRALSTLL